MTPSTPSWSRAAWVWFVVLTTAVMARVFNLDESFWIDEAMSAAMIAHPWDALMTRVGFSDVHPPGYYLLLKAWAEVFGSSDWALRSLSLISSLGTIALVTNWTLSRFGVWTSLFAGLALSTSTFHVHYATEARSYALFGFVSVAFFLSLERWITRGNRRALFVASVCEWLAVMLHYYGFIAVIVANLFVLLRGRRVPDAFAWWRSQAWVLVALSPWLGVLFVQVFHLPSSMTGHLSDTLPVDRIVAAMGASPSAGPMWLGVLSGLLTLSIAAWGSKHLHLLQTQEHQARPTRLLELCVLLCLAAIAPLLTPLVMPLSETLLELYLGELTKVYGLLIFGAIVLGLCGRYSHRYEGVLTGSPIILFILVGPLVVLMMHQLKPILFLRNQLVFLPFIILVAAAGFSVLPRSARLCILTAWLGLAPLSLANGPDNFMPRQDFQGVTQHLDGQGADELWVLPGWDTLGVERYGPGDLHLRGCSATQDVAPQGQTAWILLSRPERFDVDQQEVLEHLAPLYRLVEVTLWSGHRGAMRLLQLSR